MAQQQVARQTLRYVIGTCVPSVKENAVKIRVPRLKLDNFLLMYFREYDYVYATDPQKKANIGDTVLIQDLRKKLTRFITHRVVNVVHPLGDVTDPVTGKKVVVGQYREEIEAASEIYGKLDSAFDYKKAKPRGAVKDTRDFTYEETYIKYYEDPDDPQPYAIDPY